MKGNFEFSGAQKACVEHVDGPALVLAGPGSGKTAVITGRAVRIAGNYCPPERLMCVTFTRAAAGEMRERYIASSPGASDGSGKIPLFSTVHAFCNRIVGMYEEAAGIRYTRIEGEFSRERDELLRDIYRRVNGSRPDAAMLERLGGYIQRSREGNGMGNVQIRRFDDISREYGRLKRERRLIDFGDMVELAEQIMEKGGSIPERVRGMFDYIQVDEAQDLSRGQYRILRLICGNGNIFAVADDDQSIYGFRGADPECLFEFRRDYPNCAQYELTANYRSSPDIVSSAAALVGHNNRRFAKDLHAVSGKTGRCVSTLAFRNSAEQARYCAEEISRLVSEHSDCAVLYRNGISGLPVRVWLEAMHIKYTLLGSAPDPWETETLREAVRMIALAERDRKILPPPSVVWKKILASGFARDAAEKCGEEGRDRKYVSLSVEAADALVGIAGSAEECVKILDAVERTSLRAAAAGADAQAPGGKTSAVLSTVHSSKGLEFDNVFMIDLVEGELPGNEFSGDSLEEERRLLYVGMTRARKKLTLCYPLQRGGYMEEQSRFLSEIRMPRAGVSENCPPAAEAAAQRRGKDA